MTTINHLVTTLGTVAVVAVVAVCCAAWLLRWFGIACMVVGTTFLAVTAGQNTADLGSYLVFIPMGGLGLGLWLAGRRLDLAQRRYRKSRAS